MIEYIVAFFLLYLWHGMGITVGYHRLLSHRSFRCNKLFEYFFVAGGYFTFQGSPIWWSAIHRAHHKYSDTPLDPHSPNDGIFHALYGWLLSGKYPAHIDPKKACPDVSKDPIYRLLECGGHPGMASLLNLVINVAVRAVVWNTLGWKIVVADLAATAIVFNAPQMLNVICHMPKQGYQNFAVKDDSTNVWWVALLACGEGWHNNHHAYPGSAQTGIRWFELDVSWLTIKAASKIGLVSWMNVPKDMTERLSRRKGALVRLERFREIRERRRRLTQAA
jgi:stearoyl-CoA desaturase (delta-9 desaturase)